MKKYIFSFILAAIFFPLFSSAVFAWCQTGSFNSNTNACGFTGLNWCAVGTICNTGAINGPQISVACPINQKLINTGTYCDYGNGTYSYSGSASCVTDSSCPIDNMSCQNIVLSPTAQSNHNGMPVYLGNETLALTVTGSSSSQNLEVYWRPAYETMNTSTGWHKINGTFNATTHIFTANWDLKNDPNIQDAITGQARPQEIVLTANNTGSVGFCSGNPCSATCSGGAYWAFSGPDVCSPNPASCCSGCQKKIVIDPTANLNSSNAIDLKDYFLLNPGNYWEFTGTNFTYPASDLAYLSTTRMEVEPPTIMCGHTAIGTRILKDKASGYWGEKFSYFDPGRWGGSLAIRQVMFYFDHDSKWSSLSTGLPWFITYGLLSDPNQFKGLGPINQVTGYETSGSQHFYFAPYLFAPRFLPPDPTTWEFKREDATFDFNPSIDSDACKYETLDQYKNDYNTRGHGWETKYGWENVTTPAYTGQALRIVFLEYGDPNTGFLLREDWFLAKNVGLVMIRAKDIYQKSLHDSNGTSHMSRNNCGSDCNNVPMVDPMLEIKLNKYYLGNALTVNSSTDWVKPGNSWLLSFSGNYTGFIDTTVDQVLADGSTKNVFNGYWDNVWVQNGQVNAPVPANVTQGKFIYKFRRHLPDLQNVTVKGENPDPAFVDNLPWSNPVTITFSDNAPVSPTPFPIPGDLNHDGKVDMTDYNQLVSDFGKTGTPGWIASDINSDGKVDIYDYNILVGNWGKTQ